MKIVAIVTHPAEIGRILFRFGWPMHISEFDENVSQLVIGTADGFPLLWNMTILTQVLTLRSWILHIGRIPIISPMINNNL